MNGTQSIDQPWGVSVFGASSVDAVPDLARLRVAISQTRATPNEAFEVTRTRVNQVREALRRHEIPDKAVSTSRLNLQSVWNFTGSERKFGGYVCTASFVIELRELDNLETVLVDVVDAGANEVSGVEFDVSTKKELRAKARAAAVVAAREKAELYAQAAGTRLGHVIHIKDIDSDSGWVQQTYRGARDASLSSGEGDLAPGKINISAGVVLGFSLINQ